MNQQNIIAINKPKGPTSHDIVDQLRRITGERRIGHAGTLDPLASGVLVIGIGREATRQLATIVAKEKEYVATIRLGATSTTDDAEGVIVKMQNVECLSRGASLCPSEAHGEGGAEWGKIQNDIERILLTFIGRIEQTPPVYSAVKIAGTPAHRRVRRGETVELKPRPVEITNIEILKYDWPELRIRVVCGPGVYIRSLARDIGATLGVGGYLTALERTRVGEFIIDQAQTIQDFAASWNGARP